MRVREKKPYPILQKIFELRKAEGISLEQLGKALGNITVSGASSVENGDAPLKAEHLPAIAKLLGVQTWELLVDYNDGEIGPLSQNEKDLIFHFRQISQEKEKKTIQEIIKIVAKKF